MNRKESIEVLVDIYSEYGFLKVRDVIDFVNKQGYDLLQANKNIIHVDNKMLEESGYSYFCDTHDHDCCGNCVVNNAIDYIKKHSLS
jgi:hypothetical protein